MKRKEVILKERKKDEEHLSVSTLAETSFGEEQWGITLVNFSHRNQMAVTLRLASGPHQVAESGDAGTDTPHLFSYPAGPH